MSNTPLRVSSDDWAEFVNAGKSLLEENKMSDEIKKQEKVVLAARLWWGHLRDKEQKAFEAWRIEDRLLRKMKEGQNE